MTSILRALAPKATGFLVVFLSWELASRLMGTYWVPDLMTVGMRACNELASGKLMTDLIATTQLLLAGGTVGLVTGCLMACVLKLSPRVDTLMQPFITAAMSVPKLGLVPLLVLWFGTGWMPKVLLVTLTVLFIVFSFTYAGLTTVDSRLVQTARVLGASDIQVTRHVVLPSVLPFVFTGLEVALPWALSAALVAEYLSAKVGIGHGIEQARQMSDSVGVFYGIAVATGLVLFCNGLLAVARKLGIKGQ